MAFAPLPPPKTPLGYYRMLSPTASVRVSPLCLGAMNFGEAWYVDFSSHWSKSATNKYLALQEGHDGRLR
jgi:hypothetical protein